MVNIESLKTIKQSELTISRQTADSLVTNASRTQKRRNLTFVSAVATLAIGFTAIGAMEEENSVAAATYSPVTYYLNTDGTPSEDSIKTASIFSAGTSAESIAEKFIHEVLKLKVESIETQKSPVNYIHLLVKLTTGARLNVEFYIGGEMGYPKLATPRLEVVTDTELATKSIRLNAPQSFSEIQNRQRKLIRTPESNCDSTSVALVEWRSDKVKVFDEKTVPNNNVRNVYLNFDANKPTVGFAIATCTDGKFLAAEPIALLSPKSVAEKVSIEYQGVETQLTPVDAYSVVSFIHSFHREFVPNNVNQSPINLDQVSVKVTSGYAQKSPKEICDQFEKEQGAKVEINVIDSRVVCGWKASDISLVVMEIAPGLLLEVANIWTLDSKNEISPNGWNAITSQIQVKVS